MRATYVQPGHVIEVTAPAGGVTVGGVYVINELLMVAMTTAAEGDAFAGRINGVFYAEKVAAEAWAEGDAIYFDADANLFTSVAEDTTFAGIAARAVVAGRSLGYVLLNGIAEPSAGGAVSESSLVHQASVTLTDDQIKALPSVPVAVVAPTEILNYAGNPTQFFLPVSGAAFLTKPNNNGYGNVDAPNLILAWGSDWSTSIGLAAEWQEIGTAAPILGPITGAFSDALDWLLTFIMGPSTFGDGSIQDNGIFVLIFNDFGDLLGGDPDNTLKVSLGFLVFDVALGRHLTVAESGWNETTRLFE